MSGLLVGRKLRIVGEAGAGGEEGDSERVFVVVAPGAFGSGPVTLASTFPDATYVITHRDPVAIMASFCTMVVYAARMGRRPVDVAGIAGYWVDRIERMLNRCMTDSGVLPPAQTIHVRFDDFMADDMGMIERIYQAAEHPLTEEVSSAMAGYIRDNPRGKHGQVVYNLEGDFGLDREQLYRRFGPYMEHFGLRRELD